MTRHPGKAPVRLESDRSRDTTALDFLFQDCHRSAGLGQDPDAPAILEVVQLWEGAVMEVAHLGPDSEALTLGGAGASFQAPSEDLPFLPQKDPRLPLFSEEQGAFRLRFCTGWTGFLQDADGQRTDLSALVEAGRSSAAGPGVHDLLIPPKSTAWIDTGHVIFAARHVPPGRRPPAPLSDGVDLPFLGVAGFASFLAGLVSVVVATSPPPSPVDVVEVPTRIAQVMLQAPTPKAAVTTPKPEVSNKPEGDKAKGPEGKVGKRDARQERAKGSKVEMNRQQLDRQIADNAGLMGALNESGELSGVFGDSALSADLQDGIGGLLGAKGVQQGTNGLSSRGDSFGGGGRAERLGGLSTRGPGGGDDSYGEPGGGTKRDGEVGQMSQDAILVGALDKSLVDAVVKKHMNRLRYCYQRQLSQHPDLSGKVTVRFIIAADGSVSRARVKASSLKNPAVESCLTSRFLGMRFPEPQGGGMVLVTYPFYFSSN